MQWQELRSHIRHLPARDIARIGQAFELGKKMHEGQKRRSGEPYFNHPVAVAHMLLDLKADTDTIIAALLHDTVEDTPLTLHEIDHAFNGSVATIIDGVTKLSSKDVAMSPKLDEQIETLRKIFTLMQQDVRIMIIKLVDRLHNMQTVEFLPPERQRLLAKETSEVFVKIADKLCMQDMRDELESLCLAVLEPETYASLLELRNASEQRGLTIIDQIRSHLRNHDRILGSKTELVFEQKTWDQMKAQLSVGGSVATGISSITIAFVCEDIDACYRTLGALHQVWKREVLSFQDFINEPQLNGYRGVHTTIIAQDGTRVRCKIRTKEMHEYARSGITTKCFDTKALGIADYLPWTKRLSSLSTDTEGSSDDFWENLKSDILGDTIVIHGPDDTIVQLPRDSTALDAVFYLFHERALNLDVIKMNGVKVPFSKTLVNAASLEVTLATDPTWNREWLRQVKTGYATALIRMALGQYAPEQKQMTGRAMLQQILTERKRGFIEEFEEESLKPALQKAGYRSLEEVFVAIADGRMEPEDAYQAFFRQKKDRFAAKPPKVLIRYETDMGAMDVMDRLNAVHRAFSGQLSEIRYSRRANNRSRVSLNGTMHAHHVKHFIEALTSAGAENVRATPQFDSWSIGVTIAIVLLWGLDAVLTKMILDSGISPAAFTVIRSWSGVAMALLALLFVRESKTMLRIPMAHPLLWISGISFFFVNLLTNYTLTEVSPFFYKTSLRITAPLLALPLLFKKTHQWKSVLCIILLGAGFWLLFHSAANERGAFLALAMAAMFVIYTKSSDLFQASAHISIRYPQFFLAISGIAALVSPMVLLFGPVEWPTAMASLSVIAFTALFVCVPYIFFYQLHRTVGYAKLSPFFHFSIAVTFFAQWVLLGTLDLTLIVPSLALVLASLAAPKTSAYAANQN